MLPIPGIDGACGELYAYCQQRRWPMNGRSKPFPLRQGGGIVDWKSRLVENG